MTISQHTRHMSTTLPKLPGTTFPDPTQTNFHKSHVFDYECGGPVLKDAPGIGGKDCTLTSTLSTSSTCSRNRLVKVGDTVLPAYVGYDRQVLRFEAYFKEPVVETSLERFRVRYCYIYYFLDDETVQITEPEVSNSGLPQGVIVRRQKVCAEPSSNFLSPSSHYKFTDFQVCQSIMIFGRSYYIIDADPFTRTFYQSNLIDLAPRCKDVPVDVFSQYRRQVEDVGTYTIAPKLEELPLRKFLANDNKVLRYYAYWNDNGDHRHFECRYYLADDCIDIVEKRAQNSGRSETCQFMRRQQLKKKTESLPYQKVDVYNWKEISIGSIINVYGREFLIFDVDSFTRDYLETNQILVGEKVPVPDFTSASQLVSTGRNVEIIVPKHNGIGSELDSLANCLSLVPKPVKNKCQKSQSDVVILRFSAVLKSVSGDRNVIITVFTEDDTVSIYEPPVRNSGIIGGKFLERCKVVNSGKLLTFADFWPIPKDVVVNNFVFSLVEVDEVSRKWLEGQNLE
ncbi:hypothetical protein RCL1_007379 [Eukaryota sp. TZLM3-RCL]